MMARSRRGLSRVLPRLIEERADLIAWRAEDLAAGRLGCVRIADEYIATLNARIARLAAAEFDRLIGLPYGQCHGR